MPEIRAAEKRKLELFSQLATCNPFLPKRIELEKKVLGSDFEEDGIAWSRRLEFTDRERFNVTQLTDASIALIKGIKLQVESGKTLSEESLRHYWYVVIYALLYRHIVYQDPGNLRKPESTAAIWKEFLADYRMLVNLPGLTEDITQSPGHLFAILCQIHRAFFNIYSFILGESLPSVELRGKVWQSIFTCNIDRYRRNLFDRMSGLPSLITGPSGTGKELVARAIGLSQFIPFNEKQGRFNDNVDQTSFFPLNLSAMSANLIESELFGHRKGAFTGAIADREGWLELCPSHGAVFLDEIGELDPALQVKLLRVVQQRNFSRLGDTKPRKFSGKIIGATNRDLGEEMKEGRFREDLYYRLCADRIETPSLREQLNHRPDDLFFLARHVAKRLAGDDSDSLCDQAVQWIETNLGSEYPWRGNFRELEQCVSSIMIRNEYVPGQSLGPSGERGDWLNDAIDTTLTADELLQRYCTWMYFRTGGYEAAARKLKIDRRTVKAKIDQAMLDRLSDLY